jgi:branched-chain amino acid transport system substrate-binding protein
MFRSLRPPRSLVARASYLAVVAVALAGVPATPAHAEPDPLVVGVLLPMSGDNATFGEESWNGMQLAEKEIREKDPGFGFKLVLSDEQSKREMVAPQTKQLIENNGAQIVVGSVASSNTMQAAAICKEAGIPILTPASTNDMLTEDTEKYGEDVFRVCFKDSFQGAVLAQFASGTLKAKKAVSLVDKGQAYSVGLAERFEKKFKELGGTVESEYYTSADKDYTTLIQKVGGMKPDVILISGYYPQAGPMIKLGKEPWKGVPVIGGDGLDSPDLFPLTGETDLKVYFTTHFVAAEGTPIVQTFVKKYNDEFAGADPGAMAALGYDAMYAVYHAAKKAIATVGMRPPTAKQMATALRGLSFSGVTGKIVIGPDRTPHKALVVAQLAATFGFVQRILSEGAPPEEPPKDPAKEPPTAPAPTPATPPVAPTPTK